MRVEECACEKGKRRAHPEGMLVVRTVEEEDVSGNVVERLAVPNLLKQCTRCGVMGVRR